MTEPMSDALFGVDGTELPRVSADPSGRGSWPDTAGPPLPVIPAIGMTQEAIAAALGEESPEAAGQEQAAAPASAPSASPANVATSPEQQPVAPPPANPPKRKPSVTVAPTVIPASSPQRGPGGSRYRRTLGRARPRVQLRAPRRRSTFYRYGLPTHVRSNGGAGAFFVIMLIIFAVLLYFIIAGIVESIARLLP